MRSPCFGCRISVFDPAIPIEQVALQLGCTLGKNTGEIRRLLRVAAKVEQLVRTPSEVMDEFLVAPHPAEARLWIVASRADRHLRMRDHEGTALEVPRLHGETEEPEHRGRDVELRGRIGAHSGPYQGARGIMQQQRDSQRLLVRHVVVGAPAVLAESLAVVGDDDKESVPVQSRCLVLIEERPQKEVVSPKGVEITIQLRIVRIPLWSMPGQQCAPIVRVYGEVRGKKRLRALLRFE